MQVSDICSNASTLVCTHILGLDVAVHYVLCVHVLHRLEKLLDDMPRNRLAQPPLLHDDVEELAASDELHEKHEHVIAARNYLIERNNLRVLEALHDLDLSQEAFSRNFAHPQRRR